LCRQWSRCFLLGVSPKPWLIQVSFPFYLSSQTSDPGLSSDLYKKPQSGFYRRALGSCAAASHGLPHQLIIDLYVSAHSSVIRKNLAETGFSLIDGAAASGVPTYISNARVNVAWP
jgi:hypothetical protein